jgi:hypothetical protein
MTNTTKRIKRIHPQKIMIWEKRESIFQRHHPMGTGRRSISMCCMTEQNVIWRNTIWILYIIYSSMWTNEYYDIWFICMSYPIYRSTPKGLTDDQVKERLDKVSGMIVLDVIIKKSWFCFLYNILNKYFQHAEVLLKQK